MKIKYKIVTIIGLVSIVITLYFIAFSNGIIIGKIGLKPIKGGVVL